MISKSLLKIDLSVESFLASLKVLGEVKFKFFIFKLF